ncbi:UDP-N-acetylmuramate dehydrogenase [Candidatus Gottesmanbacteria bacterium]|nr:UDP-N-acetylmuramate dehydrogenase [Candidatus Gottesmanbacteria bacterium]
MMAEAYQTFVEKFPGLVKKDVLLAPYTTFKIGGPADLLVEARNREELVAFVLSARDMNIPITFLGGGSNLLIGDRGIRGLVVRNLTQKIVIMGMKGAMNELKTSGTVYVEADSGVPINKFVRYTVEEGLSGLEMHLGLPGSVGGAVYMNSKWTNPVGYVGDAVYQASILTNSGEVKTVPKRYFQFAYDMSILQKTHELVLSVVFTLKKESKELLWKQANESIAHRRATQPQGVFTAGCIFQNLSESDALTFATPGHSRSAGYLIDSAGFKGKQIGGAVVSSVHANFIVNMGKASASDVLQLISMIKEKVHSQFGVTLKEEIQHMGEF